MDSALKSSQTEMSAEKFQKLIDTIRTLAPPPVDPAVVSATEAAAVMTLKSKGSFSNFRYRFGGERGNDAVENFITRIEAYKQTEDISDENALKGLSLLFVGLAAVWWKGVKRNCKTWKEALTMLRESFEPTKQAYQIYLEFFQSKQYHSIPIDIYVCQQRVLLAKLPEGRHDEQTELDFIYGLLNLKYREQITRNEIKSFRDLLEKSRHLEQLICQSCNRKFCGNTDCRKRAAQSGQLDVIHVPSWADEQQNDPKRMANHSQITVQSNTGGPELF